MRAYRCQLLFDGSPALPPTMVLISHENEVRFRPGANVRLSTKRGPLSFGLLGVAAQSSEPRAQSFSQIMYSLSIGKVREIADMT